MKKNLGLILLFLINYGLFRPPMLSLAQGGFFSGPINFASGAHPVSVAVGDFNGDGKQDLAVLSGNISILLGNGDGSFSAARNFTTYQSFATSMVVGDFNADGKQDLVVVGAGNLQYFRGHDVTILMGNGDGGFEFPKDFTVGDGTGESVVVGDFNRDGKQDLAVAYWSGFVSILMGNGDGTFSSGQNVTTGEESESVVVGDFNGDGKQDVAVANFRSGSVSILLGNGDGSFGAATNLAVTNPYSVVVGDFNRDGKQDLAVGTYLAVATDHDGRNVSILLGDGKGGGWCPHIRCRRLSAIGGSRRFQYGWEARSGGGE